jgi:hypothetical protein
MGGKLVRKFVKHTKVNSRPPNQGGLHQFLFAQAEPQVGAAQAAVLGKTDSAAGRELGGLDLPDGVL